MGVRVLRFLGAVFHINENTKEIVSQIKKDMLSNITPEDLPFMMDEHENLISFSLSMDQVDFLQKVSMIRTGKFGGGFV